MCLRMQAGVRYKHASSRAHWRGDPGFSGSPRLGAKDTGKMHEFTPADLARCNGQDGAPAYIAYKGKVYDVTDSFLWRRGRHQVLHQAGEDLTDSLDLAPHGEDLLERVPIIGILK